MVTTNARRHVVTRPTAAFQISARRACRLVGLARSRSQYRSRRRPDTVLCARLMELAAPPAAGSMTCPGARASS